MFVGKTTKKGSETESFAKVKTPGLATHIKIKNSYVLVPVTGAKIKRKEDEDNPESEVLDYSDLQFGEGKEYVVEYNGKYVDIDDSFYAQLAFMNRAEKGDGVYYRCDDGTYIKKNEITIPSYKKLPMPDDHDITVTRHGGEYYTKIKKVAFKGGDGKEVEILLPNENVTQKDNVWYFSDNGNDIEVQYKEEEYTVTQVLLDDGDNGKRIIDLSSTGEEGSKIIIKDNRYVLVDSEKNETKVGYAPIANGEELEIAKEEYEIGGAIVRGSSVAPVKEYSIGGHTDSAGTDDKSKTANQGPMPSNYGKQRFRIESGENLEYVWDQDHPSLNGFIRLEINANRNVAKATFVNGDMIVFVAPGARYVAGKKGKDIKVQHISKFTIEDTGEGIKFEVYDKQTNIAENVQFTDGKVSSYEVNGSQITDILWTVEKDGVPRISSYTFNGVKLSNIEWNANGEVEKCTVHITDEEKKVVEEVENFQKSKHKDLGITYNITENVKDVKVNSDGKISFKMGDFTFSNATTAEDGKITTCTIKYKDKKFEIEDLSTDKRFAQLSAVVTVKLNELKIVPLIRSKLIEKVDGEYKQVADVVQGSGFDNGVAIATEVTSVEEAVAKQEEFKRSENKYTTVIIDDNGVQHQLSDYQNTYNGVTRFENQNNAMIRILGTDKVSCKDGQIVVDASKDDKAIENWAVYGFALCMNPFTLVFGIGALGYSLAKAVYSPIKRAVVKSNIVHKNAKGVTYKIQENAKEVTQENINKVIKDYKRKIKYYKSKYSDAELRGENGKLSELRESFLYEYNKAVAGLHLLDGGKFDSYFDMARDTTITPENYLAYLAAVEKRKVLKNGAERHPDYASILKSKTKGIVFDTDEAKKYAAIKVMEEHGSRDDHINAHKWKMKNVEHLLKTDYGGIASQYGTDEKGKKALIALLKREYDAGRMQWGSMADKLSAYKESEEYRTAENPKKQRELLKKKKKQLQDEMKNIVIESVELHTRYDKDGKPLTDTLTERAVAYREEALEMFTTMDTRLGSQFSFKNNSKKNSKNEMVEKEYPKDLTSGLATVVTDVGERDREVATFRATAMLDKIESRHRHIIDAIQKQNEKVKTLRTNIDFEDAFILGAAIDSKVDEMKKDASGVEKVVDKVQNVALLQSRADTMKNEMLEARVQHTARRKGVELLKSNHCEEYQKQVQQWAVEEFVSNHPSQYYRFVQSFKDKNNGVEMDEASQARLFLYHMQKQEEIAQSVNNEFEMLKVKNDIEASTEADVYCEDFADDFKAFIDAKNQGSSKQIDPNSDIARCLFYSHCRLDKDKNNDIQKWKKTSQDKIKAKAVSKLKEGKLKKHDKKKQKVEEKKVEAKNDDVVEVTPALQAALGV